MMQMEKTYYLPISSASLAHYFGAGYIAPSIYFPNKPNNVQDKAKNKLILIEDLGIRDSDCCLEIIITLDEKKELEKVQDKVFLFAKPLPISRVKSVIFSDVKQKDLTITNIEMSTAFIPKQIIKVDNNFEKYKLSDVKFNIDISYEDYSEQLQLLNRLLGCFSLMKLGGEEYMNYSPNYFSTLSFFNKVIEDELSVAKIKVNPLYHDAFVGQASFKSLNKYLYKTTTEDDLIEVSNIEKQLIIKDKITKIVALSSLEKASFIVAVLNTYGVGSEAKKKKVDGLILSNFKSDILSEKSEVVSLCYGLNRGYSAFNNSYKSGNKIKDVKFKLDSQLDYYTIESLYQYAFYKIRSEAFPYLDNWCPKQFPKRPTKKANYLVLDVEVIAKNKPQVASQTYLSNLLHKLFQKDTASLLNSFITQIRDRIYEDTLEEVQETLDEKQKEINELKQKISSSENEKSQSVNEPIVDYSNAERNIEERIKEVLHLKNLKVSDFKKVAKSNNVSLAKDYKDKEDRDSYIIKILNSAKQGTLKML
jgi:ADP-ribosyltransferase-like protein, 2 component system/ADP-ribose glycohydrolase-like protein, 2 component system